MCFGIWEDDPETNGSPEDHCAASQVAMRIKWTKSGARQCPEQSLVQSAQMCVTKDPFSLECSLNSY